MKTERRFVIPSPSTAIVSGPSYGFEGGVLALRFTLDDDGRRRDCELRFSRARAVQHRVESFCQPWQVEVAYDTLVEVLDSQWVEDLREAARAKGRDCWPISHFVIYLDSFGCLEVVAETAEMV